MSAKTIAAAIDRSITHNEIAHVDLSDLLRALIAECIEDGDLNTSDMAAACLAEIVGDDEDSDDGVPQAKRIRQLCRQLIDDAQEDHDNCDDVEVRDGGGHRWQLWGEIDASDGVHSYRVHIRCDA